MNAVDFWGCLPEDAISTKAACTAVLQLCITPCRPAGCAEGYFAPTAPATTFIRTASGPTRVQPGSATTVSLILADTALLALAVSVHHKLRHLDSHERQLACTLAGLRPACVPLQATGSTGSSSRGQRRPPLQPQPPGRAGSAWPRPWLVHSRLASPLSPALPSRF